MPEGTPSNKSILESEDAKRIVAHNLQIMEDTMQEYIDQESVGGNAGRIKLGERVYPCAGISCLVDLTTGKINSFKFSGQYDPGYQRPENTQGLMLRVALPLVGEFRRVVEILGLEEFSLGAQNVFRESVRQYNAKHGRI